MEEQDHGAVGTAGPLQAAQYQPVGDDQRRAGRSGKWDGRGGVDAFATFRAGRKGREQWATARLRTAQG